ncbi:MAG: hypothetical protein U9Q99_00525 [Nanoarchaeota archaeon]|nr:hypothetical protein [Nanoarchaeota archaeon]
MGFIRGSLVFTISLILFLTLFSGGAFWTFSKSLEYETVQPQINELSQEISERIEGSKFIQLDNSFGNNFYYKDYDCKFINCFKEDKGYLVLVSDKARVYWKNLFRWTLILSVILLMLLLLVSKPKNSAFIVSGILMIGASLIYKKLSWIMSLIPNEFFVKFSNLFISKSEEVFLVMIISGGVLLLLGIILHFFNIGMKISKWIARILEKSKTEKTEKKVKEQKSKIKEVKEKNIKLKSENKKLKEVIPNKKDSPDKKLAKKILNNKSKTLRKPTKEDSPDKKLAKKILKDKKDKGLSTSSSS